MSVISPDGQTRMSVLREWSGQISPSGYTWSSAASRSSLEEILTFIEFHSISFIIHSFGPLSQFPANGTVGAITKRKLNVMLVNQVEGEGEDGFSR